MVVVSVGMVSAEDDRGSTINCIRVVVAYLCKTDEHSFGPSLEGSRFNASSPTLIHGRVQMLLCAAIGFAWAC